MLCSCEREREGEEDVIQLAQSSVRRRLKATLTFLDRGFLACWQTLLPALGPAGSSLPAQPPVTNQGNGVSLEGVDGYAHFNVCVIGFTSLETIMDLLSFCSPVVLWC